jgi:hypothetical protein
VNDPLLEVEPDHSRWNTHIDELGRNRPLNVGSRGGMTSLEDRVLDLDRLLMSCSYRGLGLSVMKGLVVEGKCTRVVFGKLIKTFLCSCQVSVTFGIP